MLDDTSAPESADVAATAVADSAPETAPASATESVQAETPAASIPEAASSQPNTGAQTKPQAVPAVPAQQGQPTAQQVNWEKRFKDQQPYLTRLSQERAELAKRYDGIDPQQARAAIAELERLKQQQQASPFSRRHADYTANKTRIDRADLFVRGSQGLDDQQAREMAARMGVTAEDIQLRNQSSAYRERMIEDFASDPEAFVVERIDSRVDEKINAALSFLEGRTNAERWLSDPKNDQIVKSYAPDITRLLDNSVPLRDKVAFLGEKLSRLEALEKQLGQQAEQVSQANAQQAILTARSQGSTRRGNATSPKVTDARAYVTDVLKIKPNDQRFISKLQETNDRIRSGDL